MNEHEPIEPEYTGTVGGAYSTEEHLHAQQSQASASTGEPLIEAGDAEAPDPAGDHDDPAAAVDDSTGASTEAPADDATAGATAGKKAKAETPDPTAQGTDTPLG